MQDIICSCGNKMEFQCYVPTPGKNAYTVMRGIYKCPNCKNTEYVETGHNEFKNDVYTKEYLEEEKKDLEELNGRKRNYILTFVVGIIIFGLFLYWFNI